MIVIKRKGELQDFEISKIKTSVMRASDDIDEPLNESDISFVADKTEKFILENFKDQIKSSDIHKIVVDILNDTGFTHIAKVYNEGTK